MKCLKIASETLDLDQIVDEIEFLVPKYVTSVEKLKQEDFLEDIPVRIKNMKLYWDRLSELFQDQIVTNLLHGIEAELKSSLQIELETLESIYFPIHSQLHNSRNLFDFEHPIWNASESLLKRMEEALEFFEFSAEHKDRVFIREIMLENAIQKHKHYIKLHKS